MAGKDIAFILTSNDWNPLDLKEIFFTNLLLLGFDPEAEEAKYRIPFNRDMFVYPNKKGMEVVCHFLFCRLDPQLAFQEFRDCWPIQDKKMEQQFRRSCHSWLSKLHKEEPDSNLPRAGQSLFLSPGGGKFYTLMFYLSKYVLKKVMGRDYHGKHVNVPQAKNPKEAKVALKALKAKVLLEKSRFFEDVQRGLEIQENWKTFAMSLTKEHRKLTKENRELERKLPPKDRNSFEEETAALHRTRKLQEVRELWKNIQTFYNETKEKREILNTIIEEREECFCIDGSEIQLQIPEALVTEYKHYIQMNNIGNTYQAGKLNLLSLIQLCSLALRQIKEQITQDGIQNFDQCAPFIKDQVQGHIAHLANAQKLRLTLIDSVIPELKKSLEILKEECYANLEERYQAMESGDFSLGLLPVTPLATFSPSSQPLRGGDIAEHSLRNTTHYKATPDAVENLMSNVREMATKDEKAARDISTRSVEGSEEIPRPFSKIPRPINKRQSQTPNVPRPPSVIRRASLTNPTKKTGTSKPKTTSFTTTTKSPQTSVVKPVVKNPPPLAKYQSVPVGDVLDGNSIDNFRTPLRKSALKSARNVLAEKIAKAVFADEPKVCNGNSSSQSSSGTNTPKDVGVADPLGNIDDQPFHSKDLIPRTPFKEDPYSGRKSDEENTSHLVEDTGDHSSSEVSHKYSPPTQDYRTPTQADPVLPMTTPLSTSYIATNEDLVRSGNSYQGTPKQTEPFSFTWKTPGMSSADLRNTSRYTPIETKLTVVDIDTPYATRSDQDLRSSAISQTPRRLTTGQARRRSLTTEEAPRSATTAHTPRDSIIAQTPRSAITAHIARDSIIAQTPRSALTAQTPRGATTYETRKRSSASDQTPRSSATEQAQRRNLTPPTQDEYRGSRLPNTLDSDFNYSRVSQQPTTVSDDILDFLKPTIIHQSPLYPSDSTDQTKPLSVTPHQTISTQESSVLNFDPLSTSGAEDIPLATTEYQSPGKMTNFDQNSSRTTKEEMAKVVQNTSENNEKSSVNDLLLRYQQLKKQQELQQSRSTPDLLEDEQFSPTASPIRGEITTPLLTSMTTPVGLGNDDLLSSESPSHGSQYDINANSFQERENVKSRLFLEHSPNLESLKHFSIPSPSGSWKSDDGLFSVGNLLQENLVDVDTGDLFTDDLVNIQSSFKVGEIHEHELSPSVNKGNERSISSHFENMNINSPKAGSSVETGPLIDFD